MGGARFSVSFSPNNPETHMIQVTFNDDPVPGKKYNMTLIVNTNNHSTATSTMMTIIKTKI